VRSGTAGGEGGKPPERGQNIKTAMGHGHSIQKEGVDGGPWFPRQIAALPQKRRDSGPPQKRSFCGEQKQRSAAVRQSAVLSIGIFSRKFFEKIVDFAEKGC
ncbi:MAG: hypothetical protein PT965_07020, partial [Clostridia bacterium]|nr:hypothetical protein [Clostridia bacterium]